LVLEHTKTKTGKVEPTATKAKVLHCDWLTPFQEEGITTKIIRRGKRRGPNVSAIERVLRRKGR